MGVKSKLSESRILLFLKMIPDMVSEYWRFAGETVRCRMSKTPEKLLTEILMLTHALEKGLSIHEKKKGYGIQKMKSLANYIKRYIGKYGYKEYLDVPISMVYRLEDFHRKDDVKDKVMDEAVESLDKLLAGIGKRREQFGKAGYVEKRDMDMLALKDASFEELCCNRYAVRHFSNVPVSEDEVRHCLSIAKKSPSACNRQAYRVHMFSGEKKDKMLLLQGGANSFYKEVDKALLITGDLNRYYTMEAHLPYVDASLFGMTLIYALTANGIASIPLTMGRKRNVINACYREMGIPSNEVPVLLIAIGNYPEKMELSKSHRNDVDNFTTFH